MDDTPATTDLVLIGGGHAHVHVLKMLGMNRSRTSGIRITVVSSHRHTPYSGMLPGFLAGHYSYEQIHLDVSKLARFCGAYFVHASATCIQYAPDKLVHVDNGAPPIRYDCLSIDIGSAPAATPLSSIPVKPIASFTHQYEAMLRDFDATTSCTSQNNSNNNEHDEGNGDRAFRLAVVGGGAGGVELAFSLQHRLQHILSAKQSNRKLDIVLITRGKLLSSHNPHVQAIFRRILIERGIEVMLNATITCVEDTANKMKKLTVWNDERNPILVDQCFWCATAGAAPWLRDHTPFCTTDSNFLRIADTYELIHHPGVFAAGDCSHMDSHPRPKAGVFAVRAGPVLTQNLLRYTQKRELIRHRPQRDFLGLIGTGDKYAVASKGNWFCLEGAWLWKVKDCIDRLWMGKYSTGLPDLEQMMARQPRAFSKTKKKHGSSSGVVEPMRCGGCGAKVGSDTLSRVLKYVHQRQVQRAVALHYDPPPPIDHDDAAVIKIPLSENTSKMLLVQTIDYFRELISDPFVFGKIVAVHALSDVHAMGVSAATAMALAVVPYADNEAITENTLIHMLSGISDVLQDEGVRLVGGHTCEGLELACGLSMSGFTSKEEQVLRKCGGKVGDRIVLTKPLGTGALFAADMRAKCTGSNVREAIDTMMVSSYNVSLIARDFDGVHACTDVTGFGLVGHLLEMLMANQFSQGMDAIGAVLDPTSIPFYRGALEASQQGIFSTLQFQNSRNRRAVLNDEQGSAAFPIKYPLLFDPQTAGGLMLFVDPMKCDQFLSKLKSDHVQACVVGYLEQYDRDMNPSLSVEETSSACTIGNYETATGLRIRIHV